MKSPFKLRSPATNYCLVSENVELADSLSTFLNDESNKKLWAINTVRQKMTHALRHTESISLRKLNETALQGLINKTIVWNQVLETKDTDILTKFKIFQQAVEWIHTSLLNAGANRVEFGRIFFSNHHASTSIDEHIDEGAYFDYYDRFHFCVTSNENNIFKIRDQECILNKGGLFWVNNHVPHSLRNNNDVDRINLIVDARLEI